jgi:hypothetical protein
MHQKLASPLDESYPSFFFESNEKRVLTQLLKNQHQKKEQPKSIYRTSHSNNTIAKMPSPPPPEPP